MKFPVLHKLAKPSFCIAILFQILSSLSNAWAADPAPEPDTIKNDTEVGIVSTTGNTSTESFNFSQSNNYKWDRNRATLKGKFLNVRDHDADTSLYWSVGTRFERDFPSRLGIFTAETFESDIFSGYLQRYATDLGGKYGFYKENDFYWNIEAGYRYTIENQFTQQAHQHFARIFTEANHDWTKSFSTKGSFELLPSLQLLNDFQWNIDLSASTLINEIFAIKLDYLVKYRNLPPPPAMFNTDTQFTTALVAKF